MRKVKFTKAYEFAENGHSFTSFKKGQVADVTDSCADTAILSGAAKEVSESKSKGGAPENKSQGAAPENKAKSKKSDEE